MARLTLTNLVARVHLLVGNHSKVTTTEVQDIIEAEDEAIFELYPWRRRIFEVPVWMTGVFNTGTCTFTKDSASITFSTAPSGWDFPDINNLYVKSAGQDEYFRIITYTSGTSATLETTWDFATETDVSFEVFGVDYAISDISEIVSVRSEDGDLTRLTRKEISNRDPNLVSRNDPTNYALAGRQQISSSYPVKESLILWPVSSSKFPVFVKVFSEYSAETTTNKMSTYPTDCLRFKSAQSVALLLNARTGDKRLLQLADRFERLYANSLAEGKYIDSNRHDSPKRTTVSGVSYDDDFTVSHDIIP